MSQAQQNLELLILRIHSGLTYRSARVGIKIESACKKRIKLFRQIEEKIYDQKVSALAGLQALQKHWTLLEESEDLAKSKSYLPQLQFKVLLIGSLIMGLASQFLFPKSLQADVEILLIASALAYASYLWSQSLLKNFEKEFWLNEWNLILSEWLAGLRSGRTFAFVLSSSQKDWENLPIICRKELDRTLKLSKDQIYSSYEEINPDGRLDNAKNRETTRNSNNQLVKNWVLKQIELLRTQSLQGISMEPLLTHMIDANRALFKRRIIQNADNLQMQLLLPVFVFLVPAFMMLLFAPLLKTLLQLSR